MSETDPARKRILAAMDAVLAGEPGSWTISELSRQARVGRHLLTQKHTDLRDRFTDRRNALRATTDLRNKDEVAEIQKREKVVADLRAQAEENRATINGISRTVQALFQENARLRDEGDRLRREIERLRSQISDADTVVALHRI